MAAAVVDKLKIKDMKTEIEKKLLLELAYKHGIEDWNGSLEGATSGLFDLIDEVKEVVIKEVQSQLLKQMYSMIHVNGYPSPAVPHATILELPALMRAAGQNEY